MTAAKNAENLRPNKSRFSLIVEQIMAFTSTLTWSEKYYVLRDNVLRDYWIF